MRLVLPCGNNDEYQVLNSPEFPQGSTRNNHMCCRVCQAVHDIDRESKESGFAGFFLDKERGMLPKEFLERMEQMLGEEYPAFLESITGESSHALRVNPGKCQGQRLKELGCFHLEPVEWSENGYYYGEEDRPGRHPFHAAGAYYIQDASAQAVAVYLDPRPGERVLDLCAAPGGKSTQIGAAMKGEGILFCNEIHPARARILSENVERMGIRNALVTSEAPQRLAEAFPEYFHRILVDAPCSGEGMFRKNGEAIGEWSPENVDMCAGRQDEILDAAAVMLRPGGRLVYSTCTFAPTENEGTVQRFLLRHPEFCLVSVKQYPGMEAGRPAWAGGKAAQSPESPVLESSGLECTLRLWPHKLRGEGHFLAVLQREEGAVSGREPRLQQGWKEKEYGDYQSFAAENLTREAAEELKARGGEILMFGEQMYLLPKGCPALGGIKVLRPGLHLGTRKKNRFEPAHALALALSPKMVQRSVSLPGDAAELFGYLAGRTIEGERIRQALGKTPDKGWYLIAAEGMSLGWGKYAGGMMKNHYPKGLRW